MFRAMFASFISSTCLYLQYIVVFTQVAAGSIRQKLGEHYQILSIQSCASDDGRKYLQPTWNNKLIYTMHLVGYFHSFCAPSRQMQGYVNICIIYLQQLQ